MLEITAMSKPDRFSQAADICNRAPYIEQQEAIALLRRQFDEEGGKATGETMLTREQVSLKIAALIAECRADHWRTDSCRQRVQDLEIDILTHDAALREALDAWRKGKR
jgi:hypothetical protein